MAGRQVALGLALFALAVGAQAAEPAPATKGGKPVVVMQTSKGKIRIELEPERAPKTVANFLAYVDAGFYDGTIFHRVIPDFMIQGGGFDPGLVQKPTRPPIVNEARTGLPNDAGTIAMARTADPDSATAQFFINLVQNDFLNAAARDAGYAAFGRVVSGMDVVQKIAAVPTGDRGMHQNVPLEPVVLESARRE
jgi:peptidyl-prolyl cis-trans isomerase A (cyclophilin A)